MRIDTLLRSAEYKALEGITLSGNVLDLGGDVRSDYRKLFKGDPLYTSVNLDTKTVPDIVHDLEKPLPIEAASYEHVLLINVLEHVYEYRQLLEEAVRVLKPGGTIVIVVPFLFPVHPSPDDFYRFSESALHKELARVGVAVISSKALGTGVFAARYLLLDRLLPGPLRLLGSCTIRPLVCVCDSIFAGLAKIMRKKYVPSEYALGYCIVGRK